MNAANNDMNAYPLHVNGHGGGGADDFEKHAASSDDDDDYEPCTKRILPCLFAWCLLISSSAAYFIVV